MLYIECKGTPYEIGYTHGSLATSQISRSISFYSSLFLKNAKQTWPEVLKHARAFEQNAATEWPAFHEEMRGIADGCGRDLLDIVALNVRTEINFGLFTEGCTSLAWHVGGKAWVGQNWDWMTPQKPSLLILKISQAGKSTILQITEAGLIGKIGFNSLGLGVCLNAIRVLGVDNSRLPVHFGLRLALEQPDVETAVQALQKHGMASSAHILLADTTTALGLEFTKSTFADCLPDAEGGWVVHANHLLLEHPGEVDTVYIPDSKVRVQTMVENLRRLKRGCEERGKGSERPSWDEVSKLFEDESGYPCSICRKEEGESGAETLFCIVMELKSRRAVVRLGRPTEVEEVVELGFGEGE